MSPQHTHPFIDYCGVLFSCVDYCMGNVHQILFSLLFLFELKIYLFPGRALIFRTHLGIHPGNTGDKLLYCYLYWRKESPPPWIYVLYLLIGILL